MLFAFPLTAMLRTHLHACFTAHGIDSSNLLALNPPGLWAELLSALKYEQEDITALNKAILSLQVIDPFSNKVTFYFKQTTCICLVG